MLNLSGAFAAGHVRTARKLVAVVLVVAAGAMIGRAANADIANPITPQPDIEYDCKFIDGQYYCAASADHILINP